MESSGLRQPLSASLLSGRGGGSRLHSMDAGGFLFPEVEAAAEPSVLSSTTPKRSVVPPMPPLLSSFVAPSSTQKNIQSALSSSHVSNNGAHSDLLVRARGTIELLQQEVQQERELRFRAESELKDRTEELEREMKRLHEVAKQKVEDVSRLEVCYEEVDADRQMLKRRFIDMERSLDGSKSLLGNVYSRLNSLFVVQPRSDLTRSETALSASQHASQSAARSHVEQPSSSVGSFERLLHGLEDWISVFRVYASMLDEDPADDGADSDDETSAGPRRKLEDPLDMSAALSAFRQSVKECRKYRALCHEKDKAIRSLTSENVKLQNQVDSMRDEHKHSVESSAAHQRQYEDIRDERDRLEVRCTELKFQAAKREEAVEKMMEVLSEDQLILVMNELEHPPLG